VSEGRYMTRACQDVDFCPEQVSEWGTVGAFPDVQSALGAIGKELGSTGIGYVLDMDNLGQTAAIWQSGQVALMNAIE
jgi:hypothetical protein